VGKQKLWEQLSAVQPLRGCDGEHGERQWEVAKLGEQLSAVQPLRGVVMESMVSGSGK